MSGFTSNFTDGPWAGKSISMDSRQSVWEYTYLVPDAYGKLTDTYLARYTISREYRESGMDCADFKLDYMGLLSASGGFAKCAPTIFSSAPASSRRSSSKSRQTNPSKAN